MKNKLLSQSVLLMCLCFFLSISASAQNVRVTLNMENEMLETVMDAIEQQVQLLFVVDDGVNLDHRISINVNNAPLSVALDKMVSGMDVSWSISETNIIVSPKVPLKSRKVTGKVVDNKGLPVPGVSVLIEKTNMGTVTDLDGFFALEVPGENLDDRLEFNSLGYNVEYVPIGKRNVINVTLAESALELEGTVVTALGIKRSRKALNYNVQEVSSDDMNTVRDVNFVNALNGKVAGVTINSSSSGVGGESQVIMRGVKSISQGSGALYVIDGVPILTSGESGTTGVGSEGRIDPMSDINPEDIQSVSVLTGAAAAALYGSNAANGAIVITTKKGEAGKTELTFSSNTEVLTPIVRYQFQNRYANKDGEAASWGPLMTTPNTLDPVKDFFQTGIVATENVTFSTGNDRNQVFASVGAVNSRGVVPNNAYNKYNFSIRSTSTFLKDKLHLDVGASYVIQTDRNNTNQGIYSNPLTAVYLYPRGESWEFAKTFEVYDPERNINVQNWEWMGNGGLEWDNPYWSSYRVLREHDKKRYMFNASLTYDILDWLKVTGRVRVDNSSVEFEDKKYATTNTTLTGGSLYGHFSHRETFDDQTYADALMTMDKRFGQDWTVNATLGASISDMQHRSFHVGGSIRDGGLPNVFTVGQINNNNVGRSLSSWHDQTQSVFGSAEVGFKGAVYLTATGRNDWPSQLAGSHSVQKGFFYSSVGGSVVLSQLIDMPDAIEYLKVYGSWASVGLPFKRFIANPTYSWNGANGAWETAKNYPMYDLRPERTNSWEAGVSFKGLGGFSFDFGYYDALTFNQTFDSQLSVSSGYTTLYVQTGQVRNRGIELSLGYDHDWGKFGWNTNFTLSMNKNIVESLMDGYVHPETGEVVTMPELNVGGLNYARFILRAGGSLGDMYTSTDLLRDDNGNPYITADGKVSRTATDGYKYLGSVFPKANLAWNNEFTFGDLSLGVLVSARLGGIVYSATQAYMDYFGVSEATALARDAGGVPAGDFIVDSREWYQLVGAQGGLPQYYIYDATNVRISEAHIGYTIPKKVLGNVCSLTVSFVGRNLLMIYCKAPFDPESVASTTNYYQGIDSFMMPSTRNVGLSLRLKF